MSVIFSVASRGNVDNGQFIRFIALSIDGKLSWETRVKYVSALRRMQDKSIWFRRRFIHHNAAVNPVSSVLTNPV